MTETVYKHSSGGVVFKDNQVLLIRWPAPRDSFDLPKGSIEPHENPKQACLREVLEETGYRTEIVDYIDQTHYEYDWVDGTHHDKIVDYYLLRLVDDDEPVHAREEHETFENVWVESNDALQLLTRDIDKDILKKAIQIHNGTIPDLRDSFEYKNKVVQVDWYDCNNKSKLPGVPWQQVYVVANLHNKIPVVLYEHDATNLPGGKTDPGETVNETVHRELLEELNCRVLSWEPIGYQKLTTPGESEPTYQLRVYADIEKIGEFENDPGGGVIGYKLIDLGELNSQINYGQVGARIMRLVRPKF